MLFFGRSSCPRSSPMGLAGSSRVASEQPITAVQHLTTEKKQQAHTILKSEKTTKKLLGEFYSDKKFLENLLPLCASFENVCRTAPLFVFLEK